MGPSILSSGMLICGRRPVVNPLVMRPFPCDLTALDDEGAELDQPRTLSLSRAWNGLSFLITLDEALKFRHCPECTCINNGTDAVMWNKFNRPRTIHFSPREDRDIISWQIPNLESRQEARRKELAYICGMFLRVSSNTAVFLCGITVWSGGRQLLIFTLLSPSGHILYVSWSAGNRYDPPEVAVSEHWNRLYGNYMDPMICMIERCSVQSETQNWFPCGLRLLWPMIVGRHWHKLHWHSWPWTV